MSEEKIVPAEEQPASDPPVPEITEENFVPDFHLEFDLAKKKRRRILLICAVCAAVFLGLFIAISRSQNLYTRILRNLQFDYRYGESIDELSAPLPGTAEKAAEAIGGKNISLTASEYIFNSDGGLLLTASEIAYSRQSSGEAQYSAKTSGYNSLKTIKSSYRCDAAGNVTQESGDYSRDDDRIAAAHFYDFCFRTEASGSISEVIRKDACYSTVGENHYTCELWLMSFPAEGKTQYFTLYRYYTGGRLAALRIINSSKDLMYIYDIKDYTAE